MSKECSELHCFFSEQKRFTFHSGFDGIAKNGIYIMFEKGEHGHSTDRVVRIGTHTGMNQLPSRIHQHFELENKNRSIFRKNIGRCLLKSSNYADKWEFDTTSRINKEKYLELIDPLFEKTIEAQISEHIHNELSFVVIPMEEKEERLRIEDKLIATVSNCEECKPSASWLGRLSPKEKIVKSGLRQVNGLWGENISESHMDRIFKNGLAKSRYETGERP